MSDSTPEEQVPESPFLSESEDLDGSYQEPIASINRPGEDSKHPTLSDLLDGGDVENSTSPELQFVGRTFRKNEDVLGDIEIPAGKWDAMMDILRNQTILVKNNETDKPHRRSHDYWIGLLKQAFGILDIVDRLAESHEEDCDINEWLKNGEVEDAMTVELGPNLFPLALASCPSWEREVDVEENGSYLTRTEKVDPDDVFDEFPTELSRETFVSVETLDEEALKSGRVPLEDEDFEITSSGDEVIRELVNMSDYESVDEYIDNLSGLEEDPFHPQSDAELYEIFTPKGCEGGGHPERDLPKMEGRLEQLESKLEEMYNQKGEVRARDEIRKLHEKIMKDFTNDNASVTEFEEELFEVDDGSEEEELEWKYGTDKPGMVRTIVDEMAERDDEGNINTDEIIEEVDERLSDNNQTDKPEWTKVAEEIVEEDATDNSSKQEDLEDHQGRFGESLEASHFEEDAFVNELASRSIESEQSDGKTSLRSALESFPSNHLMEGDTLPEVVAIVSVFRQFLDQGFCPTVNRDRLGEVISIVQNFVWSTLNEKSKSRLNSFRKQEGYWRSLINMATRKVLDFEDIDTGRTSDLKPILNSSCPENVDVKNEYVDASFTDLELLKEPSDLDKRVNHIETGKIDWDEVYEDATLNETSEGLEKNFEIETPEEYEMKEKMSEEDLFNRVSSVKEIDPSDLGNLMDDESQEETFEEETTEERTEEEIETGDDEPSAASTLLADELTPEDCSSTSNRTKRKARNLDRTFNEEELKEMMQRLI